MVVYACKLSVSKLNSYYRKEINDCYKILTEEDYPFDRQIALGAQCNCSEPIVAQFCSGSYIPNQQYVG